MRQSASARRMIRRVVSIFATAGLVAGLLAVTAGPAAAIHPTVAEYQLITASATPPTEAQCLSVGRTCFTPQAIQSAYNLGPLYAADLKGQGMTIAIVDAYGSDTIAHDLHVFDQAFGVQPMCGEEGVTCTADQPTFSQLALQGSPATKAPPAKSNGTGLENKSAWALEVSLDVEMSHAIAPKANILLVTTPTAETLGVQGFHQMMAAEDYVVQHHLANVISQSFASAEDAFGSAQSLLNLRYAFVDAAANGVTVLGSSGDGGTANSMKQPVKNPRTIPYPTVEWPASDPLVTGVGGTYLCTDPTTGTNDPRTHLRGAGRHVATPTRRRPRSAGPSAAAASATSLPSPPTRTRYRREAPRSARCAACPTWPSRPAPEPARSSISPCRRTGSPA